MNRTIKHRAWFLDVLEALVAAADTGTELSGYEIARGAKRSAGSVYLSIDNLEGGGWVTSRWEDKMEDGPRRRFYQLTPKGLSEARALLAEYRPPGTPPSKRRALLDTAERFVEWSRLARRRSWK